MAINNAIRDFEIEVLNKNKLKYDGLRWCELGNQTIINDDLYLISSKRVWTKAQKMHKKLFLLYIIFTSILFYIIYETRKTPAKKRYISLGVKQHTSMDLNGKDGSIAIDLNKPVPKKYSNSFDVVTNYGTLEHVNNQYQSFKNVHDMCKKNGLIIHIFPAKGWSVHGRYCYTEGFIMNLANACNYEIIKLSVLKWSNLPFEKLLAVAFKKSKESVFVKSDDFEKLGIIDTRDTRRTENYTKISFFKWLLYKLIALIRKTWKASVECE